MRYLIFITLLATGLLQAQTLSWIAPTEREDGKPIQGELSYEVLKDGVIIYGGSDTSLEVDLVVGSNCYMITASEDGGVRSKPSLSCFTVIRSPPVPPIIDQK